MEKCFCKKRSNGESRNSTQIKVWNENAKTADLEELDLRTIEVLKEFNKKTCQ